MRESILTIPINEVFEPKRGCPICAMRNTVEDHICEYIMGAAMMEPDVRIETNKLGFCREHYNSLLKQNNRLSLALMLDTHLAELRSNIFDKKDSVFSKGSKAKKSSEATETCFVCSKVNWGVNHMMDTLFNMWNDEGFRKLYSEQEYVCLPHYNLLMNTAAQKLKKDVHEFCNSFDYRNAKALHNEDKEHVRSSIERAIEFITSRKPDDTKK